MSFLGKFFAGRADVQPKDGENGGKSDDAPPQAKRVVAEEPDGNPNQPTPKKKFEKPMFKLPIANTDAPTNIESTEPHLQKQEADENPQNMSVQVESHLIPEESQPSESRINTSMTQPATSTPGKPMSFLEKMKIKKQQEAMLKQQKLDESRNDESSQQNEIGKSPHQEDAKPVQEKPKFGFMNKFKQKKEQSDQDASQDQSQMEPISTEAVDQEDQNQPEEPQPAKLAFKFLSKKKAAESQQVSQLDIQNTNNADRSQGDNRHEVHIDYSGLDQDQSKMLAGLQSENYEGNIDRTDQYQKAGPSKPRFGFLSKAKLALEQDNSMAQAGEGITIENPNENTLNLSPVDKEKSFNMNGDLVDTLEKDDSGKPTPRQERSHKVNSADFVIRI